MSKKSNVKYRQCTLTRAEGAATVETVSWLPVQMTRVGGGGKVRLEVGMTVDLKEEDGTWTRDWTVKSMSTETETPPDWRAMIRGHRKQTGDSNPKRTLEACN